jgi:hypothetical protein
MEKILETTLGILRTCQNGMDFVDLVRLVAARAKVDEATAKASILQLNFEGGVRIDSDWLVCPAESKTDLQEVPQTVEATVAA